MTWSKELDQKFELESNVGREKGMFGLGGRGGFRKMTSVQKERVVVDETTTAEIDET